MVIAFFNEKLEQYSDIVWIILVKHDKRIAITIKNCKKKIEAKK